MQVDNYVAFDTGMWYAFGMGQIMNINKLHEREDVNGITTFWWGKKNITALWMDFFSGLSMEDEKRCVELFLKKYEKKLSKEN